MLGHSGLAGVVARIRSLWHGLRRRGDVEAEMSEEFRHHLDLRAEDLIRRGLTPKRARRQARLEFGHIDSHKETARASRGLRFFDQIGFSWLDVKLGLRMLAKYPGLSLVSVFGLTVAIAIGAGGAGAIGAMMDPTLPLPEGDRIVSVQNRDVVNPGDPDRRSLHDFVMWRDELESVRDLAATTMASRTLVTPNGSHLVRVAQITASGFRVARVAPLAGRPLLDEDERTGAQPVVVIGYEEWQRRFDGDPDIVGSVVRLGGTMHTVVGVMPEGFRFPVNHGFWIPLRLNPTDYEVGGGPEIRMFGRLADGATMEEAQAELTTIGRRMAASYPRSHEHLRPRVMPYTHPFPLDNPGDRWMLRAVQLAVSLLVVVVAVNVGALVYARTATRTGEIAVRSALGASRKRVVTQLFVEALVLSITAAAIGLAIAGAALEAAQAFIEGAGVGLPFWIDLGLSPGMIAYVVTLAVLGGAVIGVVPAIRATGRRVHVELQQLSSRGSRMQLGGTWTTLIVAQVAIAVAVLPFAVYVSGQAVRRGIEQPTYPIEEFLRASLAMERVEVPPPAEAAAYERALQANFLDRATELIRRLEADPAVAGVTYARHFPGDEGYDREIELEGERIASTDHPARTTQDPAPTASEAGRTAREVDTNDVATNLFDVFGVPILAGRGFVESDAREGSTAVIVDQAFADRFALSGRMLGRRVRFVDASDDEEQGVADAGPWLEIVGVVPVFTVHYDIDEPDSNLYRPMTLAQAGTGIELAVRTRGDASAAFAGRLRKIAATVDPTLQLRELRTAADVARQGGRALLFLGLGIAAATASVLLLSAAGIYAMTSFTVARRRREIGIRSALGADSRRILTGIFARAGAQLGAGVLAGLILAAALERAIGEGPFEASGGVMLPVVVAIMMAVGLLAALGPARRGLAVQPTEVLREE